MELPIDHFRLLGVSPSSTTEEVLRYFQLRLDRTPEEGFTPEVLAQRSELLRRSADLLCDLDLRQKYETALLGGALGLEFSSNREVAGLILLWEADIAYEAFKLARKALQPPQAPALGSGRESDLILLAALACKDAALQEQEQRHYSSSAELLEEGIQLLQRMGKLPDYRQKLERELETLLPYRILDLLSRDLSDQRSHQDGLNLLDGYVLKRGGLEGKKLYVSKTELSQSDFELFFQQIRTFLTVQEQIDLFSHWQKNGSSDAGFLFAISLVASGFSRRKPESLQKARKQLSRLSSQGFDAMPLLGCIDLLLGDVNQADQCFSNSSDKELKEWLDTYPGETLAAFCDYSRNWLLRDVLPGFRDIEYDSVDLEAWFADRDVQIFIERNDKRGALGFARAGFSLIAGKSNDIAKNENPIYSQSENEPSSLSAGPEEQEKQEQSYEEIDRKKLILLNTFIERYKEFVSKLGSPVFDYVKYKLVLNKKKLLVNSLFFIIVLLSGGALGWFAFRNELKGITSSSKPILIGSEESSNESFKADVENVLSKDSIKNTPPKSSSAFEPLTSENPTEEEMLELIQTWLKGKADILSGGINENLSKVARNPLVKIVNDQRQKDQAIGEKQIINAQVRSLQIESQTNKRIAVRVEIYYQDKRLSDSGVLVSETSIPSLKVKYILGRKKDLWKLVDFSSES